MWSPAVADQFVNFTVLFACEEVYRRLSIHISLRNIQLFNMRQEIRDFINTDSSAVMSLKHFLMVHLKVYYNT